MSDDYSAWVGRQETRVDRLETARSQALLIACGDGGQLTEGSPLPPLHHWLHFWDIRPPLDLGTDGHPKRGGFLPPVSLPRRMWAGGRVRFHAPLMLGEHVTRDSTIVKVETKSGRSGTLVFVTVRHELTGAAGLAITEEQDIVYREAAAPGSILPPSPASPPEAPWQQEIMPDPVLLFRYSALTMNGHRIHYDRPYAMAEEAYPGLVVHGPLQASLLITLAARHLGRPIRHFDFRGQAPAFDGMAMHICGEPTDTGANLWTTQGGVKNMVATVC